MLLTGTAKPMLVGIVVLTTTTVNTDVAVLMAMRESWALQPKTAQE